MLSAVPLYARQGKTWPSRLFGRHCGCGVCLEELPLSPALLALGQDGHSIVFADIKLRVSGLEMLSETVFLGSFSGPASSLLKLPSFQISRLKFDITFFKKKGIDTSRLTYKRLYDYNDMVDGRLD